MNTCGPMYLHPFRVEIFEKFDSGVAPGEG